MGQFKSAHTLSVGIAYDFNDTYTEMCTITPQNNPSVWGDGDDWGSDDVWGGTYYPYQFRINPARKKCTSIRITVQDNQISPNYGEGYSISNMSIEVGVLSGSNKIAGNASK